MNIRITGRGRAGFALLMIVTGALIFSCAGADTFNVFPVTRIEEETYYGTSSLGDVVIPAGTEYIGPRAFAYSGLTSVSVPSSVTAIDEEAFYCASSLESVYVPEGTATIGKRAFAYTGIKDISVPSTVSVIDTGTFSGTADLERAVLQEGTTFIGTGAFADSGLKEIRIPASVTFIADDAFRGCSIEAAHVPGNSYAAGWCADHLIPVISPPSVSNPYLQNGIITLPRSTAVGDTVTLDVSYNGEWSAVTANTPGTETWLSMTGTASGTGDGQITFTVTAVPGTDKKYLNRDIYATAISITGDGGDTLPLVLLLCKDAAFPNTHINTGNYMEDVIAVAETQLGFQSSNVRNDYDGILDKGSQPGDCNKYAVYMDINGNPWCASFVSWCLYQAGVPTTVLKGTTVASPKDFTRKVTTGEIKVTYFNSINDEQNANHPYLKRYGIKADREDCAPQRGDLIFFRKLSGVKRDVTFTHVGIVMSYANGIITYIDGNGPDSNDTVMIHTIEHTDPLIAAYFTPWQ